MVRIGRFLTIMLILALVLAVLPVQAQAPTVTVTNNSNYGTILTDSTGMTLYMFTKDTPNVSNCSGQCLAAWPPLLITAGEPSKGDGISGALSTITLADGTRQVTYNEMPLYYWAGDTAAGDATGFGVNDVWFTVHPDAPGVVVSDQNSRGNVVTIASVASFEPGWLVVHADADGLIGPVVGFTAVVPGWNGNVEVSVDTAMATQNLYAMLHVDRGAIGTYEFPGADVPVTQGGAVVSPRFFVTGLPAAAAATAEATVAAATGTAEVEATAIATDSADNVAATVEATTEVAATVEIAATTEVATTAATAEVVAAEATTAPLLPQSGGAAASALGLALAGLGALVAGGAAVLSRIRRR